MTQALDAGPTRAMRLKPQYVPQYPVETIRLRPYQVWQRLLAEHGIRSKWDGRCLILRGQSYRMLPADSALRWLLRTCQIPYRTRKGKVKLRSPKVWFTYDMDPSVRGRNGLHRIDLFQIVSHPTIFWDERKPEAIHARKYMKLWWDRIGAKP